ncbi:hypothetical protein FRB91_006337 [Serendipita sp. 411]|nr:hypothetical protein FRB91_006337 [Serendipita sp. 411]
MSKTATRTTGQKRKHEEISSVTSPPATNGHRPWDGASTPRSSSPFCLLLIGLSLTHLTRGCSLEFDPSAYQNGHFINAPYNSVAYTMQAQAYAHAQAQNVHLQGQSQAGTSNQGASTSTPGPGATSQRGGGDAGGVDRTSYNQLKDAMSVGGVSLRAEEQYAQRKGAIPSSTYTGTDRIRKQTFFPEAYLAEVLKSVASHHGLKGFKSGVLELTGLAVEQRMRELIEKATFASRHRWDTQTDLMSSVTSGKDGEEEGARVSMYADGKTPVFDRSVKRDVGKQLLLIEKLEKEEEMRIRRERKEKQEQARQGSAANSNTVNDDMDVEDDGPPKKKKKRAEGPGVQAKNMSEETKKKLSNTVANAAAGFGNRYAWMNAASTPIPRRPHTGGGGANLGSSSWGGSAWNAAKTRGAKGKGGKAGDKDRTLNLRDVMFAVEREKGHGGGRGSARGWS